MTTLCEIVQWDEKATLKLQDRSDPGDPTLEVRVEEEGACVGAFLDPAGARKLALHLNAWADRQDPPKCARCWHAPHRGSCGVETGGGGYICICRGDS